jgi:hypothetical protein
MVDGGSGSTGRAGGLPGGKNRLRGTRSSGDVAEPP